MEPLYSKVANRLEETIRSGELKPGNRLPPERQLLRDFDVSRATLRSALSELEQRGLISRHQGRGTFVQSTEPIPNYAGFFSLRDAITARGLDLSTKVLGVCEIPAGRQSATDLGLLPGDPVIEIQRLRTIEGEPLILETGVYPSRLFPGLMQTDLEDRSLYETMRSDYGHAVASATTTYEPVLLTPSEADQLDVPANMPAMMIRRISQDKNKVPVELSYAFMRGDRCRFVFQHQATEPTSS